MGIHREGHRNIGRELYTERQRIIYKDRGRGKALPDTTHKFLI